MTTVVSLSKMKIQPIQNSRIESVDFENLIFGTQFSDHMFVADWENGEWKDPTILPYQDFKCSPALSALHYGQTIFEGMKAFSANDGSINLFRPVDHLKRLNKSGDRFCMPPVPESMFMEALQELVSIDRKWIPNGGALYLRPIYFATEGVLGVHDSNTYKLVIFSCPVKNYYSTPLRVKVISNYVRAADGGVGYVKTAGNYARSMQASKQAKAEGFSVVLWLDGLNRKYIEEYSTMNAFFVIDGITVTPATTGTILEGITRNSVIQLLQDNGFPVAIRDLSIHEVMAAGGEGRLTEAFGTGTAAVAAPVELIQYGDLSVNLSDSKNWKIMNFVKNQLAGIRSGEIEDTYKWMTPVC